MVLDRINDEYGYGLYIPEAEKESVYEAYKDMTPEEFEAEILKELEEDAKGSGRILNNAALLLDSEIENRAYIKMADELGATKLRKFDLIEVIDDETPSKLTDYVRKDELQDLLMSILQKQEKEVIDDEQIVSTTKPIIRKSVG